MNLNHKLALLVLLATVTTGLLLGTWNAHQTQQALFEDAREQGTMLAHALGETQVARLSERQVVDLTHSLRRIVSENADISYVFVTDFDGEVFAHSFDGGFPHEQLQPGNDHRSLRSQQRDLPFGEVLEIDRPVIDGLPAHIYVGMDMQPIRDAIAAARWQSVGASVLTGVLIAMLLSVFSGRMIRPVGALTELMEDYGRGASVERPSESASAGSSEIATLYDKFFDMIDDREAVQLELHAERNFVNAIVDKSSALILILNPEGRIVRFNPACERVSGFTFEEAKGQYVWDLVIPPEEREGVREKAFMALKNNPEALVGSYTNHWCDRDGGRHLLEWSNSLLCDSQGRMEYMIAVGIDVTDRKQTELELQQFKSTLDRTLDCVFMFDAATLRFIYVNQGATEQVGYSREQMLQMHPYDIKPDISEARFKVLIGPLLQGEKSLITFETRHRHRDGHDIPVEISLQYIQLADERPRFVAVVRDITERKKAEAELQKLNQELENRVDTRTRELAQTNAQLTHTLSTLQHAQSELVRSEKLASLGSLVAGVAHELSTPLGNSLMVASTLGDNIRELNRELVDETLTQESLESFLARTDKAAGLLNSSLLRASEMINHFKQVAVDQTSAKRREFDLGETIGEVIETLQPRFKKTPYELSFEPAAVVRLDSFPGPLGQVITNLALNALVHAFEDSDHGRVIVSTSELDQAHCRIQVSDNGKGIAPENLSQIFDPFFTTRFGQGGSGLGLHIVYTIVNRILGGRISVDSEPGSGTRFDIDIPLTAPTQADTDRAPDNARDKQEDR